jgi:hypothetical protein
MDGGIVEHRLEVPGKERKEGKKEGRKEGRKEEGVNEGVGNKCVSPLSVFPCNESPSRTIGR